MGDTGFETSLPATRGTLCSTSGSPAGDVVEVVAYGRRLILDWQGGDGFAHEPKWDGYRAAVVVVGDVQIMSRRGTDLTEIFPDLAAALGEHVADGTLLDAEVVVLKDGRLSFDALQHRMAGRAKQGCAARGRSTRLAGGLRRGARPG